MLLKWIDIAYQIEDKFNYDQFSAACESAGVAQLFRPEDYVYLVRLIDSAVTSEVTYMQAYEMSQRGEINADFLAPVSDGAMNKHKSCCGGEKPPEISIGFGDTVAKITHATGLDKLSKLYTEITGKDCGCNTRRAALNKLLPYKK